jgi:hypothetical protein
MTMTMILVIIKRRVMILKQSLTPARIKTLNSRMYPPQVLAQRCARNINAASPRILAVFQRMFSVHREQAALFCGQMILGVATVVGLRLMVEGALQTKGLPQRPL